MARLHSNSAGVALALLTVVSGAPLGGCSSKASRTDVEARVLAACKADGWEVTALTCPDAERPNDLGDFKCQLTFRDGQKLEFGAWVRDTGVGVESWRVAGLVPTIEARLRKLHPEVERMDCGGRTQLLTVDDELVCTVESRGQKRKVRFVAGPSGWSDDYASSSPGD